MLKHRSYEQKETDQQNSGFDKAWILLVRFLLPGRPYTQAAFRALSQRSCCASYRSFSQATA